MLKSFQPKPGSKILMLWVSSTLNWKFENASEITIQLSDALQQAANRLCEFA